MQHNPHPHDAASIDTQVQPIEFQVEWKVSLLRELPKTGHRSDTTLNIYNSGEVEEQEDDEKDEEEQPVVEEGSTTTDYWPSSSDCCAWCSHMALLAARTGLQWARTEGDNSQRASKVGSARC